MKQTPLVRAEPIAFSPKSGLSENPIALAVTTQGNAKKTIPKYCEPYLLYKKRDKTTRDNKYQKNGFSLEYKSFAKTNTPYDNRVNTITIPLLVLL